MWSLQQLQGRRALLQPLKFLNKQFDIVAFNFVNESKFEYYLSSVVLEIFFSYSYYFLLYNKSERGCSSRHDTVCLRKKIKEYFHNFDKFNSHSLSFSSLIILWNFDKFNSHRLSFSSLSTKKMPLFPSLFPLVFLETIFQFFSTICVISTGNFNRIFILTASVFCCWRHFFSVLVCVLSTGTKRPDCYFDWFVGFYLILCCFSKGNFMANIFFLLKIQIQRNFYISGNKMTISKDFSLKFLVCPAAFVISWIPY